MKLAHARMGVVLAAAGVLLGACTNHQLTEPVPSPVSSEPATGLPADSPDTLAVLVSNFDFGPDMKDADTTARYYCSMKAEVPIFVRRDQAPELKAPVLLDSLEPSFAIMIYRCETPAQPIVVAPTTPPGPVPMVPAR